MGWYNTHILPRLVTCACGTRPILRQRQKVVPKAHGTVLEIGLGAGHNLPHYTASAVERIIAIDPCETSWALAQERVRNTGLTVDFHASSAESLPLENASIDSVLLTFALCTIPDPGQALAEAHRVLKPGGQLLFCEHGLAPDPSVAKWQARINPFWRRAFGGCHLNRDIPALLSSAGFSLDEVEQMYLPGTPRFAGFNTWGIAGRR